jgi:hypothetical protein
MKRAIAIGIAISLTGCTFATKTFAPDGRQAFSISCDGLANSWGGCFRKAGSICKEKGYDVFTRSSDGGLIVTATPTAATGGSVISRNLIIACKSESPAQ